MFIGFKFLGFFNFVGGVVCLREREILVIFVYLKYILVICCLYCWVRGIVINGWNEIDLGKEWFGLYLGLVFFYGKMWF